MATLDLEDGTPMDLEDGPATPTLAVVDNGDDTGATATVSGSSTGSTNTIYAAPWAGGMVPASFTSIGSRVSDGTVNLALALGYWWVYCQSVLSGDSLDSNVCAVHVTDGTDAIFQQCLDALTAKIAALSLPSPWQPSGVIKQKFPWNRGSLANGTVPAAIFITPSNDRTAQVLNQADDFGLAIQITAVQPSNQNLTANLSAELLCRQQLMNAVLPVAGQQALAGVPSIYNVLIEPGPVLDEGSFSNQYDVSAFIVRCINRRTRGLT